MVPLPVSNTRVTGSSCILLDGEGAETPIRVVFRDDVMSFCPYLFLPVVGLKNDDPSSISRLPCLSS